MDQELEQAEEIECQLNSPKEVPKRGNKDMEPHKWVME
jgi:hypothetical protein